MDNMGALEILQGYKAAILVLDSEYKICFVNKYSEKLLNRSGRILEEEICYELFYGLKEPCQHCPWKDNGNRTGFSERQFSCMGQELLITGQQIVLESGDHYILTVQSGSGIRSYVTQIQQLLDNAADAVIIADASSGNIVQVNAKAEELTGFRRGELVGKQIIEIHPPERESEIRKDFKNVAKGGRFMTQTEILHKSGRKIPVEINPAHFTNTEGQNLIMGFFRNLDHHIDWQVALAESEKKYEILFETVKEGILVIDESDDSFEYVNPAMCRFLGYKKEEMLCLKTSDIHPKKEFKRIRNDIDQALAGGISTVQDVPCLTRKKKIRYADIHSAYMTLKGQRYIAAFFTDTTERRRTEQELRKINKELRESDRNYRKLFNEMTSGFAVHEMLFDEKGTGSDYRFLEVNPAFEHLTGLKAKTILNKRVREVIPGIEEFWIREYGKVAKTGKPISFIQYAAQLDRHYDVVAYSPRKGFVATVFSDVTDRVKTLSKLVESEERYRKVVESSPSIILVVQNEELLFANLMALNKTGYASLQELQKTALSELIHPDDSILLTDRIGHDKKELRQDPLEIRLRTKKGPEILVESISLSMMYNDKPATLIICNDISKRKRAERNLAKAHESFRTIAENLPDMLLRVDTQFKCTYVSPNVYEYTHIRPDEYLGKKLSEVELDPDFSKNREQDFKKLLEKKESSRTVITVRTEKGNRVMEWRMLPEVDEQGNVESILNLIRDITEIRRTEAQLNQLFNLSVDLICIIDRKGPFVKVNPAWEVVLGYSMQELLDTPFFDLIHPDDLIQTYQNIADRMEKDEMVYNFENRYRCKNGEYKWLSWVTQPFGDENLLFAIARDISDQKEIVNELIRAKEKAEESDKLKSAFLANMSHEIRTPMNAIVGFASLLMRDKLDLEKRIHYARIIQNRSEDLLSIISDILDISKIESNQINILKEEFSINEVFSELYVDLKQKLQAYPTKKVKLEIDKKADPAFDRIVNDRVRIKQVLSNLIDNAIKFTEEGQVSFGCVRQSDIVQFYVSDTGIGISKEFQKNIFLRFRQVDDQDTRKYGGNGLGLSISKALVEMMGGEIWLDSVEGKGTTFYFKIPALFKKTEEINIEKKKIGEGIDLSGRKVLIVEDEPLSREYLGIIIRQVGGDPHFAESGELALIVLDEKTEFDLILMDIHLPDMNGYDVTRQIRNKGFTMPIVAQTAFAMTEDEVKCLEAGCTAYLSKPVKSDDLLETIQRVLS